MDDTTVISDQELNKSLRQAFIQATIPHAIKYINDVSPEEILIVQQEEGEEQVSIIKINREKAAVIYDDCGAPEIATMLRTETHIPGTCVVCFNAYNGFNAMLLMPNTTTIEA